MQIQVTGKDIDLGGALQAHVEEKLSEGVRKYFDRPAESKVMFSTEGHGFRCDCVVHLSSGIVLASQGESSDVYASFDAALAKLEKRVRRYKRRLKNHHADKGPMPTEEAAAYIIAAPGDEETHDDGEETTNGSYELQPAIIAEMTENVREMTVSMAVMQLDLSESPVLLFKNAAHGGLNVVYRRQDGNFGWIDPSNA